MEEFLSIAVQLPIEPIPFLQSPTLSSPMRGMSIEFAFEI
jgi:hypothetical protein